MFGEDIRQNGMETRGAAHRAFADDKINVLLDHEAEVVSVGAVAKARVRDLPLHLFPAAAPAGLNCLGFLEDRTVSGIVFQVKFHCRLIQVMNDDLDALRVAVFKLRP